MMCISQLVLISVLAQVISSSHWNVSVQLNPGCNRTDCSLFNIVHVCGRHVNFSTHFLFAASKHIGPSVLALYSSEPEAQPKIYWDILANGSSHPAEAIHLEGVQQSYSTVFTQLIEFDDTSGRADMSQISSEPGTNTHRNYLFNQFNWNLTTILNPNPYVLEQDEILHVNYVGDSTNPIFGSDGSIKLVFMLSNTEQHNTRMPSLRFVPGLSLQFELQLLKLHTNYSQGRFAIQLGLISQDPVAPDQDFVQTTVFSINDEVVPGIFTMLNIRLGERSYRSIPVGSSHPGGFVQTRPVCYVSDRNREVKTSRDALLSPKRDSFNHSFVNQTSLDRSLPYWFYGNRMQTIGVRVQNVSFGTPDDGYYANSDCVVWSASFGFGEPPVDALSALLIGILCLSAVVVVGSLLIGSVLLLIGRLRQRRTPETQPLLSGTNPGA